MSNFPFNSDKYDGASEEFNGSPLNYKEAFDLMFNILMWHSQMDTSDWTQSNDGMEQTIGRCAWGLIELLSDPNAVKRLGAVGETVARTVATAMKNSRYTTMPDKHERLAEYLNTMYHGEDNDG